MLERLVEKGYNLSAWREASQQDSDNGGRSSDSELRGTQEQQLVYRLQEIELEILKLTEERTQLLG